MLKLENREAVLTMYLDADQSASAFFRVLFQLSLDNRKKLL